LQIDGQFDINAPLEKVWENFLNPVELLPCIPGAQEITPITDNNYSGVIKEKVGPIVVKIKGEAQLTDIKPKKHLTITGKGTDLLKAGKFSGQCNLDLEEIAKDKTRVTYNIDVQLVGRLATFGQRIIVAKVKSSSEKFGENLNQKFSQAEDIPVEEKEGFFTKLANFIKWLLKR